jgi:hypothetical protein
MRREELIRSIFVAVSCVACGRAKQDAPAAGASASASVAFASASAVVPPKTLVLPEGRCTIREKFFGLVGFAMRLEEKTAPYADARSVSGILGALGSDRSAELRIPSGAGASLGLHLESPQLVLDGLVDPASIPLRAAKPIVLGGLVVPTELTELAIVDATTDGVTVEPALGAEIALTTPLRARMPCASLALAAAGLDAASVLPAKPLRHAGLHAGKTVALSVEPGGAAAAKLTPVADVDVQVLEARGAATRIAYQSRAWVFGWVSTSDLGAAPAEEPGGRRKGEEGVMGKPAVPPSPLRSVACATDVPLVAEVAGVRATIGRVRATALVQLLGSDAGFAQVRVPSGPIVAASGARWLIAEKDLEGCPAAEAAKSPFDDAKGKP